MSIFILIMGLCSIAMIIMMMYFPGFLKTPFAPLCDNVCKKKD